MISTTSYLVALIANVLWFTAAFYYWSFHHKTSAKLLVPKSQRSSVLFPTMVALVRFLGGMNAAFSLLSAMLLILWIMGSDLFIDPTERGILLLVLAAAHFSQFIYNVPILKQGGRIGESYWNVKSGPMYFIFVVDALEVMINVFAALIQFIA